MNLFRLLAAISFCACVGQIAFPQATLTPESPIHISPEIAKKHLFKYVPPNIPGDLILSLGSELKLQAVIARDGSVSRLKVLEGHALLYSAAIEAARNWKYRPFVVNGRQAEVVTEISVEFRNRLKTCSPRKRIQ